MPDLEFAVEGAEAIPHAAIPLLALKLRVKNAQSDEEIHSIMLRCQVQIEPARRNYSAAEKEKLFDLFAEPARWARTVRPLLWMNTSISVPGFTCSTLVELQLPCSFDFNVATTKYFYALQTGEIPVTVLFSGTVFYRGGTDNLQVAQVPWNREAGCRVPVELWKRLMDQHYPNAVFLELSRDAFERLYAYKVRHGIPTWERVVAKLLPAEETSEVEV